MIGTNNFPENPNPKATIGFVIYYPFQYYVYKNAYKHLAEQAEFVVDLGIFFPKEQPRELVESLIDLLVKEGVRYRILDNEDYYIEKYLSAFFKPYRILVSTWMRGCMARSQTAHAKKVHMTYGAGKELTTFGLWKKDFDLILAYGNFDHHFYSLLTRSVIVGNPKFDDWFNKTFDEALLGAVKQRLDANKKTVLYLPTHSDLSSIAELAPALKKLTERYNVLTKLHYYTAREQPELVRLLENSPMLIMGDESDLLTLLSVADVVVSDNSSAIFDAVLADKPVAVTDFHPAEYFDSEHRSIRVYRRGETTALTYSNSIEQRIKRDGTVISFTRPTGLESAIVRALEDVPELRERRKKLRENLFAYEDARSGARAAAAIKNLLGAEEAYKPFLYYAIEHRDTSYGRLTMNLKDIYAKKITRLEETAAALAGNASSDYFTCLLFAFENSAFFEQTLSGLCHQNFPKERYEVSVVCRSSQIAELESQAERLREKYPDVRHTTIRFYADAGITDALLMRALAESRGSHIATVCAGTIPPGEWLLVLQASFKRHPGIIGAGGYVYKNDASFFDELSAFEIGKRLRILSKPAYLTQAYEMRNNLFEQNPAGDIANMAYSKEFLLSASLAPSYVSAEHLGLELKAQAVERGELLFLPLSALSAVPRLSLRQAFTRAMNQGAVSVLFALRHPNIRIHDPLLKEVVINILYGYQKGGLTFALVLMHTARSLGVLHARTAFFRK